MELDLSRYAGVDPVECVGGVRFPEIGELPYLLTLPGHGFYWFQLPTTTAPEHADADRDSTPSYGLPAAGIRVHTSFDASEEGAEAHRPHVGERPVEVGAETPIDITPMFDASAPGPVSTAREHVSSSSGLMAEHTDRGGDEKGNRFF